MTAKGEAEPWFVLHEDRQIINLEHVLPKKPEEHWPEFSEDDVARLATRAGNLALLRVSDNSDLKSLGFDEKKQIYADSPYLLTNMIAESDGWSEAAIEKRQQKLAELAVKTWPLTL